MDYRMCVAGCGGDGLAEHGNAKRVLGRSAITLPTARRFGWNLPPRFNGG